MPDPSSRAVYGVGLLELWVPIPQGGMEVFLFFFWCVCVWSGSGLWDELISRLEESYRLWCVVLCDLTNLKDEEAMTRVEQQRQKVWVRKILHQTAPNTVQCLTALRSWKCCYLAELLKHSCIASRATEKTRWASRTCWANISICYKFWAKLESRISGCWSKISVEYTSLALCHLQARYVEYCLLLNTGYNRTSAILSEHEGVLISP